MAARRKMKAINTKLMVDIIIASIVVQKAPALIAKIVPIQPTVTNIVGAGAGYVAGVIAKKPNISDASLALGVTGLLNPLLDNFIGAGNGLMLPTAEPSKGIMTKQNVKMNVVEDYTKLNDYIENPSTRMTNAAYRDAYTY